jgi:cytochrome P450
LDTATELYYDPYDFEIDEDPYPIWRRLREEQPLYYNEKYDFWALSRFEDVENGLKDWKNLPSGNGTLIEMIKTGQPAPAGLLLFDDPPVHDVYRGLLSRVFTPRKMTAIEPQVRQFCADTLDELRDADGFDFVVDLGAQMPMRVIGMLLGIPDEEQAALREHIDASLALDDGEAPDRSGANELANNAVTEKIGEFIDWRMQHPADDIMTALITTEFEDHHGVTRTLHRDEALMYIQMLAAAGNETTTKLIGFIGQTLSDHPDQRREIHADRSLIPQAVEEVLRFESPSPIQARYVAADREYHGQQVPQGSTLVLLNGSGNRDDRRFPDGDSFDIHRKIDHHIAVGYGIHFCLGAALARLEGRVALDEVLNRWPDWTVDRDRAERAHTSTVRGWNKLPVSVR